MAQQKRNSKGQFVKGSGTSWNKGKKCPQISMSKLGSTSWNKGLKGWTKGTKAGFQKGNTLGKDWTGIKMSLAERQKISNAHIGVQAGSKHPNWKGGVTPIHEALRKTLKYENWRKSVFERDNYTCKICNEVGGKLNADHIKPFALFPKLRLDIKNGRTLCETCHRKTDTYGVKGGFIKNE